MKEIWVHLRKPGFNVPSASLGRSDLISHSSVQWKQLKSDQSNGAPYG